MRWTSVLAIYILFWTLSLFLVLPIGVRTAEEAGAERLPGHAESAPHRFSLGRAAWRASLVAAVFTALYVLNYDYGWIRVADVDWLNR
jgi:predicted secreted protein